MIRLSIAGAAFIILAAAPMAGADTARVEVAKSQEYGQYLTDASGRALYLFTADTQGRGESSAQVSCSGKCLDAWPPLYTDGQPMAGDKVDAAKLGTTDYRGQTMVTYNGWPLYYFVKDQRAGQATGQDIHSFGGEWYLVTPQGTKAGHH